ncbi:hypothetical protein PPGU16_69640 (plasmid) [Paraburkholderia largidicola]|uniref:Uncharacterized protein n=1 Tax=Paraburkholderia largidicola TaxID=3014751 RepID=A0A7I8BYL9_9BURK|nr:hypothetical protein PPGU16_69640 [Paraburkholderia sp. PGU16]
MWSTWADTQFATWAAVAVWRGLLKCGSVKRVTRTARALATDANRKVAV